MRLQCPAILGRWLAIAAIGLSTGCADRVASGFGDGEEGGEGESGGEGEVESGPVVPEPDLGESNESGIEPECGTDEDCPGGQVCFEGTCLNQGQLRISLAWEADADFDLHVFTPHGHEIFYGNPVADGGYLDIDDCVSGACTDPNGTHIENVYFASSPPPGTYRVVVVNYDGTLDGDVGVEVSGEAEKYWVEYLEAGQGSKTTIWSFSI